MRINAARRLCTWIHKARHFGMWVLFVVPQISNFFQPPPWTLRTSGLPAVAFLWPSFHKCNLFCFSTTTPKLREFNSSGWPQAKDGLGWPFDGENSSWARRCRKGMERRRLGFDRQSPYTCSSVQHARCFSLSVWAYMICLPLFVEKHIGCIMSVYGCVDRLKMFV